MYTIRNIVVTTDFSAYSATALEYARVLAIKTNANIHLVHVITEPRPHDESAAEEQMNKFIGEHVDEYTYIRHAVRTGNPAKEILRYAAENDAALIIIATHGRTGLAHILLGSVAENIVRLSPIPVMTVKPAEFLTPLITDSEVARELHLSDDPTV